MVNNFKRLCAGLLVLCTPVCSMQEAPKRQELLTSVNFMKLEYPKAIRKDNKLICEGKDSNVQLFSIQTGREIGHTLKHPSYVYNAALSSGGTLLATITGGDHLYLWNVTSSTCITKCVEAIPYIRDASPVFSPEASLVAVIRTFGYVSFFSTEPNQQATPTHQINDRKAHAPLLFIDESSFIYTRCHGVNTFPMKTYSEIVLANVTSGSVQKTWIPNTDKTIDHITNAYNQPHVIAAQMLTGKTSKVWLWNTKESAPKIPLITLNHDIYSMALTPNADFLIAGTDCDDHSLYLYALNPALTAASLIWKKQLVERAPIVSLYWSDDGASIVHADGCGNVTRWETHLFDDSNTVLAL